MSNPSATPVPCVGLRQMENYAEFVLYCRYKNASFYKTDTEKWGINDERDIRREVLEKVGGVSVPHNEMIANVIYNPD